MRWTEDVINSSKLTVNARPSIELVLHLARLNPYRRKSCSHVH